MTTSKDLSPLNFLAFNAKGRRYLRAYTTGTAKGRSRTKEQYHAGTLIDDFRVRLSPKFLHRFPQFEGDEWFYEKNLLKDKETFLAEHPDYVDPVDDMDDEDISESSESAGALLRAQTAAQALSRGHGKDDDSDDDSNDDCGPFSLSFLPAHAVLAMARNQDFDETLAGVFGKKAANAWLTAMAYQLCDAGPEACFAEWLADQYIEGKGEISSQRLSTLFASCTEERFDQFWAERFRRSRQAKMSAASGPRFVAFESTSITTSSSCIDAAAGHTGEIRQIKLIVVMDQATGEVVYAHADAMALNDKTFCGSIFEKMAQAGFPMDQVILVTDQESPGNETLREALKRGAHFLAACPMAENPAVEKWALEHVDLMQSVSAVNTDLMLGVQTRQQKRKSGKKSKSVSVHYYYDAAIAGAARMELNSMVVRAVYALNEGEPLEESRMKLLAPFIKKTEEPASTVPQEQHAGWGINSEALERTLARAGYQVLITDTLTDAVKAHRLYALRAEIERGFDQLKPACGSALGVHANAFRGRLLAYLLAVSIRCRILWREELHRQTHPQSILRMPGDSIDRMLRELERFKLRRTQRNQYWQLDKLSPEALQWLEVFFEVKAPPRRLPDVTDGSAASTGLCRGGHFF